MAQIYSLEAHRQEKERQRAGPHGPALRRPNLSDRELWTRDYRETDNVVFAILKIKEILDYHLYYDDVWPYLLLSFMEAVHNLKQGTMSICPGPGVAQGLRPVGHVPGQQARLVHGLAFDRTDGKIAELPGDDQHPLTGTFTRRRERRGALPIQVSWRRSPARDVLENLPEKFPTSLRPRTARPAPRPGRTWAIRP